MRVNELSKELGKTNKEVLEILQKNQFDVKSHASSISDDQQLLSEEHWAQGMHHKGR